MAHSLVRHLQYNQWANSRVCDLLRSMDTEILYRQNKSSFASIAKTITHIWDSEVVWLTRLHGKSPSSFPSATYQGSLDDILEQLANTDAALIELVESGGEDFPGSSYSYTTLKGTPATDTVEDTLLHVVNHGTYHRGQIISMLREAGVKEVVSTDLILYLRTLK